MKSLWIAVVWMLITGCQARETLEPPMISAVPAQVHLGQWALEDGAYRFDIQLRNVGEEHLKIDRNRVRIKGDHRCAFRYKGPDIDEVVRNQAAFVRIWYKPPERGFDQVALQVASNSEKNATLRIPICAEGVYEAELSDAGVGDEPRECTLPPSDQPDCPEQPAPEE